MRVGIVGGGQLGRMLALAGYRLGLAATLLDPAQDACGGQVAPLIRAAYDDAEALRRLAERSDVVTYEFENVPAAAVDALEAAGATVLPGRDALAASQDRLAEKRLFAELDIRTAEHAVVDDDASLQEAIRRVGTPALLKTRRLGYDGKGQAAVDAPADAPAALRALGGGAAPLIVEARVPFARELSLLCVRGRDGQTAFYPLVENEHRDGILHASRAPAPGPASLQRAAEELGRRLLDRLRYVGVLAVELFDVHGELYANELAPRVHNSGHWTIEGAATSQFENHLRAILGLPLGSTEARGHALMLNVLGEPPPTAALLAVPGAGLHLYGKAGRPGRKVGHVTLVERDAAAQERGRAALERALRRPT